MREGDEELGLALLRVGLERALVFPLLLYLCFQFEEGVSPCVGFGRSRWGRHRCRARLGFAVALRLALAVQRAAMACTSADIAVIQDHASCPDSDL